MHMWKPHGGLAGVVACVQSCLVVRTRSHVPWEQKSVSSFFSSSFSSSSSWEAVPEHLLSARCCAAPWMQALIWSLQLPQNVKSTDNILRISFHEGFSCVQHSNICWINDPQAMQYILFCPHISDERAGIEILTMMTVVITYVMRATF